MDGLFGYIAVYILGVICGGIFIKKTGAGNNGGNGGGLFGRFGRNRNQGVGQSMPGANMMNQGMRPGMGPQQQRSGLAPSQNQFNQPQGGFGGGFNNQNNNGGW